MRITSSYSVKGHDSAIRKSRFSVKGPYCGGIIIPNIEYKTVGIMNF